MTLILAMYIIETVTVALSWYTGWLAYVKYSGSNNQAMAVIVISEDTPLTVLNINAVTSFLVTLRLGIADSIMVMRVILCSSCH
jgi:hypothetical protein